MVGDIKTLGGPERARKLHSETGTTGQLFAGFHFVLAKNTLPSGIESDVRSVIQESAGTLHLELPPVSPPANEKVCTAAVMVGSAWGYNDLNSHTYSFG